MSKTRAILASYIGVIIFAVAIFIAGGRLFYWQAWLYLILAVFGTTISHILTPKDSNLTVERATRTKEGEGWDRKLLGLFFFINLSSFIVAGLDSGRFGWSGQLPIFVIVIGVVLMVTGQVIYALARRENAFFSSTVRIEENRIHEVCQTGPYRFVRHPGYLGMILSVTGFPLIMESYWTFVPVLLSVALLVVRTNLEDRFLLARLDKYSEYSKRVKYKLFPGLI